ncbi:MAG: hypothetical protein LBL94_07810 [Prevotellaceae bacterium]|nr:hypothetical protein [Prevotellaceae bacterium]
MGPNGSAGAATIAINNARAGTNKTVSVSVSLIGAMANNYTLLGSYTLSGQRIAQAPISITGGTVRSKTYDGTSRHLQPWRQRKGQLCRSGELHA